MTNSSSAATTATLTGGEFGILVQHAAGTVTNFGTIEGLGGFGRAIVLSSGGSVVNGSTGD